MEFISFLMRANQLCCDKVGVVYRRLPYLVKDEVHIMERTAQISKESRQSIITLRHEDQSIQKISSQSGKFQEL